MLPCIVRWMGAVGILVFATTAAYAQDFPSKPIRIITGAAGSGTDFQTRLVASGLTGSLSQSVIVDNRGSGISGEVVAKAPADGYTLLSIGSSFWVAPLLQKAPYDPLRDFEPIALLAREPSLLVVHPSLPVKSVKDLIVLAKARPGELNYAGGARGGSANLAAELFKSMAGVNIVHIAYKTTAISTNDLLGGEVQMTFSDGAPMAPHIKSGRLKVLAVGSLESSPLFPGVPAVAATVPGYEAVSVTSVFGPAKTPAAIIRRLNQDIVRILNQPEVKEKLLKAGLDAVGSSPEELAAKMKTDIVRIGKLIKDGNIRAD